MADIINKNHDNQACKANCDANGKTFNQAPYQCTYFNGSPHFNNLLEYREMSDSDILEAVKSLTTRRTNIAAFQFLLKCYEGLQADAKDGVRTQEDLANFNLDEMRETLGKL